MDYVIFCIVILFFLAIADLIIGVSNDAVNFLNSAIGSKAAPYKYIIMMAILGILMGSMFSSGIIEIARKGIFFPQHFTFDLILIIFLSVMLTDIILLDIFNSLGLPTSTTVSVVFELLGASLIVGILFSFQKDDTISEIWKYLNFESTYSIISGIFLSIIIAFISGVIFQYLFRFIFTFQYEKKVGQFGAIFSGLGLTSIFYFLLIKGLKGTTIISPESQKAITENTASILLIMFICFSIILYALQKFVKINPLRIVVMVGTFALAMAFAGNDLVNFIGVPITGFLAWENWRDSGISMDNYYMEYLESNDVIVPNYMLIIAGIIMAGTVWLSAKAKKVTETEVNLSRQDEGEERFKANLISRRIVKTSLILGNIMKIIVPSNISRKYNASFERSKLKQATKTQDAPAFDLIRASTNLIISSILIAWATSMKLPLSTTYVTFMVAMGSSLADKAWGRESAVYRVAGVLSVIGGWFVTAIIAFSASGLIAFIIYKGGPTATYIILAIIALLIIFSQINFSKKEKENIKDSNKLVVLDDEDLHLVERYRNLISDILKDLSEIYDKILLGITTKDIELLDKSHSQVTNLLRYSKKIKSKSIKYIKELQTDDLKASEILLMNSDFIEDLVQSTERLSEDSLNFFKNLHDIEDPKFLENLETLRKDMNHYYGQTLKFLENNDTISFEEIKKIRQTLRSNINGHIQKHLEEISTKKTSTKLASLQTNIYLQSRDVQAVIMRILKSFHPTV